LREYFWCNNCLQMILIEFLFARKVFKNHEFRPSRQSGDRTMFVANMVFTLSTTSIRDFTYSWVNW
jgi:hypothetical protein